MQQSMGCVFKQAMQANHPLPILGTINAYTALLAQKAGAQALYLSGAGIANACYGLPDLGMTTLTEVAEEARRITQACSLPLLVDVDTGWGHVFNIARTVKCMEHAGVAAIHIEDQVLSKRCGHRPNKAVVSLEVLGDRIKAAVDARVDPNFIIMARTDALAVYGMEAAIERALHCVALGADAVFPEAMTSLEEYKTFTSKLTVPVLANSTEFGKTPLFTQTQYQAAGVALVLYPLTAFRAMSQAALETYQTILQQGTQAALVDKLQPRQQLYEVLDYHRYEKILDELRENADDD